MKASTVYRKAAKIVEDGDLVEFCCPAICVSQGGESYGVGCICNRDNHPLNENFAALFKPTNARSTWWGNPTQKNTDARVLALGFMAAISESEGN